jgi:general secretion pathway protein K
MTSATRKSGPTGAVASLSQGGKRSREEAALYRAAVSKAAATCPRSRQGGAALLTAMMIVALVATLAGSMVWQQWRAIQVEAAERARTQSAWILSGALDWARLILREDARSGGQGGIDHLGEPWAVPLAEARLSTFLAADKDNTDDAPDAFLSGSISDVQARYNLRNLIAPNRAIDVDEMIILSRLCETVGVSVDVAARIATGLQAATPVSAAASVPSGVPPPTGMSAPIAIPAPPADPPLYPSMTRQLTWLGIDAEAVRVLEPYVSILPGNPTGAKVLVNANTATREVLGAATGLDLATAERIVQSRQRTPLKSPQDLQALAPSLSASGAAHVGVKSDFFEVRGRLRLGDMVLEQRSLVWRRQLDVTVLQRERVASRELGGS